MTGSANLYDDTDHYVTINQRVKIGNTTSHPMVKTMLIHFSKRRVCQQPGSCRSIAHIFGEVESEGEEMSEGMHMKNETNTLCMNIFYNYSIKESLDTFMGATMKPSCKIHWYSEAAQKSILVKGPLIMRKHTRSIGLTQSLLFLDDKQFLYLGWNLSVFMMAKSSYCKELCFSVGTIS